MVPLDLRWLTEFAPRETVPPLNSMSGITSSFTMVKSATFLTAALIAVALALPGCANFSLSDLPLLKASTNPPKTGDEKAQIGFAQFPDIPIPAGAKMDTNRSLVLGTRNAWIGRLAIKIGRSSSSIYDFFIREMDRFGWREITSVRSEVSVLTYQQADRIATIQIWNATLGGAKIDITVSPRGRKSNPDRGFNEPPPFK